MADNRETVVLRRSRRKCTQVEETKIDNPAKTSWRDLDTQEAVHYCNARKDKSGFSVRYININIGRGIFSKKKFEAKEFLLEYTGDLITYKEALRRENEYTAADGSFMYFFKFQNKTFCVDASLHPIEFTLGRLVNDGVGHEENAKMVIVPIDDIPHLCLFALRDILEGEEIRYNYGVSNLPWRKKAKQTASEIVRETRCRPNSGSSNASVQDPKQSSHHLLEDKQTINSLQSSGEGSVHLLNEDSVLPESIHPEGEPTPTTLNLPDTAQPNHLLTETQASDPSCTLRKSQSSVAVYIAGGSLPQDESPLPDNELFHTSPSLPDSTQFAEVLTEKQAKHSSYTLDQSRESPVQSRGEGSVHLLNEGSVLPESIHPEGEPTPTTPNLPDTAQPNHLLTETQASDPSCTLRKSQSSVAVYIAGGSLPQDESPLPDNKLFHTSPSLPDSTQFAEVLTEKQAKQSSCTLDQSRESPVQSHGEGSVHLLNEGSVLPESIHPEGEPTLTTADLPDTAQPNHLLTETQASDPSCTLRKSQSSVAVYIAGGSLPQDENPLPDNELFHTSPSLPDSTQFAEVMTEKQAKQSSCTLDQSCEIQMDANLMFPRSVKDDDIYITKKGRSCKRKFTQISDSYPSDDDFVSGSEYTPSEDEEEMDYVSDSNDSLEYPLLGALSSSLPQNMEEQCDEDVISSSGGSGNLSEKTGSTGLVPGEPIASTSTSTNVDESCEEDVSSSGGSGNLSENTASTGLEPAEPIDSTSTSDGILVAATNNSAGRSWDRKSYCPFCNKAFSKFLRHVSVSHKGEKEVVLISIEKEQGNKKAMVARLRNMGNHRHNCEVLREQKGTMIVAYRPSVNIHPQNYVPCQYCLGYYARLTLWRHAGRCSAAPTYRGKRTTSVATGRLLLPPPKGTSVKLNTVLISLQSDDISRIVKSDPLILSLGEKLYMKNGHDKDQHSVIRNAMRELGRLVKQLREQHNTPDACLEDFIDPVRFQDVIHAARTESGFCDSSHLFRTPSLALKLGHSVKKCAKIIRGRCLQSGDENKQRTAERFLDLVEMNWTDEISTHALRTLYQNKRNKVKLLPLTQDVVLMTNYVKAESVAAYKQLQEKQDDDVAWSRLCQNLLALVILFNRRRQGEASKMKLDDYTQKHKADGQKAVVDNLSPLEQKLVNCLHRVEIVGKRGRTVPVILTATMCSWMEQLLESRTAIGVHQNNEFIFARPTRGSQGHIRGSDVFRDLSVKCKAEKPMLLRSNGLRKQIATISQILNLKDNELDILANFLGHDIRVHREFYRLPEETLQLAKVSKLLISLERGQIQKGLNLDQIQVDPDEEIEMEEDEENEDSDVSEDEDAGDETNVNRPDQTKKTVPVKKKKENKAPQVTGKKRPWTDPQKMAIVRHFETHMMHDKVPGKREIEICMTAEKSLHSRTWRNVKDFIRNSITMKKSKTFQIRQ